MTDDFQELAAEFARSLKVRQQRKRTIKETLRQLGVFFDYLAVRGITKVDAIKLDTVKAYQVELYQRINKQGRPNGVAYQNKLLGAVKQFMGFLRSSERIVSDPSKDVAYAKMPRRLPCGILSAAEARKVLRAPDTQSVLGYRDRTILEVLYSTGIRKTELRDLTLNDVDYHDGFLRINHGKGGKDRITPLGRIACRYLENYIKSVRPELIKDPYDSHVFLSSRGGRLSHDVVRVLVKKYARLARIKKNIHCHGMRHSCATAMLKNKADIRVIQELLGHASLESTQVYTHLSINDLKEVHKRCHPREQDKD